MSEPDFDSLVEEQSRALAQQEAEQAHAASLKKSERNKAEDEKKRLAAAAIKAVTDRPEYLRVCQHAVSAELSEALWRCFELVNAYEDYEGFSLSGWGRKKKPLKFRPVAKEIVLYKDEPGRHIFSEIPLVPVAGIEVTVPTRIVLTHLNQLMSVELVADASGQVRYYLAESQYRETGGDFETGFESYVKLARFTTFRDLRTALAKKVAAKHRDMSVDSYDLTRETGDLRREW